MSKKTQNRRIPGVFEDRRSSLTPPGAGDRGFLEMLKPIELWLHQHPRTRSWVWMVVLCVGGFLATTLLAWPFRLWVSWSH